MDFNWLSNTAKSVMDENIKHSLTRIVDDSISGKGDSSLHQSTLLSIVLSTKPKNILHKHIILNDRHLKIINGRNNIYKSFRYIFPIAIGKASVQMAESFNKLIDSRKYIKKGLVIVNEENFKKVKNFKCLSSGHPLPNKNGIKATSYLIEKLKETEKNDIIILMLSGGGSAMLPYPAEGISLSEKINVNKILLECGAKIQEINAVRKHISRIKGGNFLRFSTPWSN